LRDADDWRLWLERHGPALMLFARQWSSTWQDAEDALQNGFIRFWRSRAAIVKAGKDEPAYVYACVRSAAMDLGRSQRRRSAHEQRARVPADESAFELSVEHAERQALIQAALAQLPGDQREVVVMKLWGGLTFLQIGIVLGVPQNTAASRYRYALARLEAELSGEVIHD
jgi:RNA polymerase sigma-70 factor (ECF subfamily)